MTLFAGHPYGAGSEETQIPFGNDKKKGNRRQQQQPQRHRQKQIPYGDDNKKNKKSKYVPQLLD